MFRQPSLDSLGKYRVYPENQLEYGNDSTWYTTFVKPLLRSHPYIVLGTGVNGKVVYKPIWELSEDETKIANYVIEKMKRNDYSTRDEVISDIYFDMNGVYNCSPDTWYDGFVAPLSVSHPELSYSGKL